MTPEQRHQLITGLVGDHRDLYQTSAAFRHAVDTLAAMLPPMVAGLAEHTRDADVEMERLQTLARSAPPISAANLLADWPGQVTS